MACGVPVVAMNRTSTPEILQSAAVLVDTCESAAWSAAIRRVLADGDMRTDLVQRGIRQAALFSWERCARQTLAVYETVVHQ
jgi:glycosyltransferase involved in cell wall biosynthesis